MTPRVSGNTDIEVVNALLRVRPTEKRVDYNASTNPCGPGHYVLGSSCDICDFRMPTREGYQQCVYFPTDVQALFRYAAVVGIVVVVALALFFVWYRNNLIVMVSSGILQRERDIYSNIYSNIL